MKKATEPRMTDGERRQLAAVLDRLARYATVERSARVEVDRLTREAWRRGATDHTIAAALGLTVDAARMRRRRLRESERTRQRRTEP